MTSIFLKTKFYWDKISQDDWRELHFPWRPSNQEVKNYQKYILKYRQETGNNVLLGSTPEIREIFAKNNLSLDIVDNSLKMYKAMSNYIHAVKKEVYYSDNWMKYFVKRKERYSMIVGDLVFRLLSNKDLKRLVKGLSFSLVDGGYLITRNHYTFLSKYDQQLTIENINNLFYFYKNRNVSKEEIVDRLFFDLSIFFISSDNFFNLKSMRKHLQNIIRDCCSKKIIKKLNLFFDKWEGTQLNYYVRSKKFIESIMNDSFKLIDSYRSDLFFKQSIEISVWRKIGI